MKNPLKSIEDLINGGANASVYLWNVTTGRSRSELSTLLLTVGSSCAMAGCVSNPRYQPMTLVYPVFTGYFAMSNHRNQKKEAAAVEKQMKDPDAENHKSNMGLASIAWVMLATSNIYQHFSGSNESESKSQLLMGIGHFIMAAGLYIESADFLPPRKSIFRKAYEKLSEFAKSYARRPSYGLGG
jgi:hypothetical protein